MCKYSYYRNALGAFIVYDLTNRSSFLNVKKWMVELRAHVDGELVITLVGNKSDLRHIRAVCTEEAQQFASIIKITLFLHAVSIKTVFIMINSMKRRK